MKIYKKNTADLSDGYTVIEVSPYSVGNGMDLLIYSHPFAGKDERNAFAARFIIKDENYKTIEPSCVAMNELTIEDAAKIVLLLMSIPNVKTMVEKEPKQ